MTEMVKLATARELVDAGAVKQAEVIGLPGGWTVQLQTYNHARVLATKANEPRRFGTFESALKVLRDLGVPVARSAAAKPPCSATRANRARSSRLGVVGVVIVSILEH